MDYNNNYYGNNFGYAAPQVTLSQYVVRTFTWMFIGLMVTFGTAFYGYASGLFIRVLAAAPYLLIGATIAELVVVVVLAAAVRKLSVGAARALFMAYAVLNGFVFSSYFMLYELTSLILIFAMTGLYFGAFALYGHFTKRDLSGLRPILMGGLIFLVVIGLLSLFLPLGRFDRIVCLIGVAVFLGFTAYDTQKIQALYTYYSQDSAALEKASVFSALQLYLDFINIFLYLLRFMGRRKN